MTDHQIILRIATGDDDGELRRLAQLDSAPRPADPVLLAEQEGRLLAALSLADGGVAADPFQPTAAAVELLRTRAAHLAPPALEAGRSSRLLRRLLSRPRSQAALAASPPGAGGRLLELDPRG